MNIVAFNPPVKHLEKSNLGKSYASGVTSLLVKNTDRFSDGQKILIGEMGRERSEIATISGAPSNTSLTLAAATEFPHDADDPVYVLEYDQVRIYRSTSGVAGVYTELATVDLDVDNRDNATYYNDENALTTYYYQLAYYDSVDQDESERTAPLAAAGYDPNAVGTIVSEIAKEVKDPDFLDISIDLWITWMNNISDDLITQAKRPYRFLKRKELLDAEEDASTINLPANLWKIDYIEVNESTPAMSRTYRPKKVSATEARFQLSQHITPGDYVTGVAVDEVTNELMFYPAARTLRIGAFSLFYYKKFDRFTEFSDIVETPNTLIYKLGLKREYYMLKADDDIKYLTKAKEYAQQYNAETMKLQREKSIFAHSPTGMAPDRKRYPQWGGRRYRQ